MLILNRVKERAQKELFTTNRLIRLLHRYDLILIIQRGKKFLKRSIPISGEIYIHQEKSKCIIHSMMITLKENEHDASYIQELLCQPISSLDSLSF